MTTSENTSSSSTSYARHVRRRLRRYFEFAKPVIPDLGVMASTDILAIDQASVDMIYAQPERDKHDLVERIESRHGLHQLTAMRQLKIRCTVCWTLFKLF